MKLSPGRFVVALCAGALGAGLTAFARQAPQTPRPIGALVVPAGFKFEVFADNVGNARMMALGPQGTVFVGSQYAAPTIEADRAPEGPSGASAPTATGILRRARVHVRMPVL